MTAPLLFLALLCGYNLLMGVRDRARIRRLEALIAERLDRPLP